LKYFSEGVFGPFAWRIMAVGRLLHIDFNGKYTPVPRNGLNIRAEIKNGLSDQTQIPGYKHEETIMCSGRAFVQ
jgi:hypothetical protein